MCLFLQVLQPLRDFVWLFLGGPPPGPAMLSKLVPSQPKDGPDGIFRAAQPEAGVLLLRWVRGSYSIRAPEVVT
jgi:hypothetical protein